MSRVRSWTFTLNNYAKGTRHWDCVELCDSSVYAIFGYERAPETNTPHLQGYIRFKDARTLSRLRKVCPTAHFEPAKGSKKRNYIYCSKGGVYVEFGEPYELKEKVSDQVARMIREGATLEEISELYPGFALLHRRTIQSAIRPTTQVTEIIRCEENEVSLHTPEGSTVSVNPELYNGEDVMILQDDTFGKEYVPDALRRGAKWYVKRGFELIHVNPKRLIIFS